MFKLNYKLILLVFINFKFSFSIEHEFSAAVPLKHSSKREIIINSDDDDDLNSRSLVVIASEIDDVERAMYPVKCLTNCVPNADELYLVSDNTLLADEMHNMESDNVGETGNFIKHKRQVSGKQIYSPQVMINPRDSVIDTNEGDSFQINCTGSSVETASFKFLDPKGETLTELNGFYGTVNHSFDGIDISEAGSYTCIGQNQYGTAKQVLQIKVRKSRLTVHIMPTNNYLTETNIPYTLYCKIPIEFYRNSIITWSYGNQTAIGNSNLAVNNHALTINSLNRKSNGIYSCWVRMNNIIKSDYIDLKVEYPPEYLGEPILTQNLYIRYDTNFTLSCGIANAVPVPVVVWNMTLHNIQRDLPYLSNEIVFNGFKPTDEGTYTCYGENPLGKTKIRTFHIFGQASVKPMIKNTEKFLEKTKIIVVMKDDTVKFLTCQCVNCMPKSIKWFYNGNEITSVDSKPIVYEETYVGKDKVGLLPLTKTNIKKSEEGEYKCSIENEFGSDTFTFDVQVVDFEATEGLDGTAKATQIKCELEEDKIYPVVIYGENDETLLGYNAASNKYENVSATGYGQKYKCATYKLIYSESPGLKLGTSSLDNFYIFTIVPNITDPALLKKVVTDDQPDYKICKFNNTENLNESNLVRSCETDGEPIIVMSSQESEYPQLNQDIELYKNIYITSKTNLFLYMCDLLPYSEKITDKLNYTCSHTPELGFGQQQFLLYRRENPSVSDTVKDHIKILPGSKELISCDGFGNPEPEVYWTSPNGEQFEQIPKYPNKLEFSIVDEEIAGNYTCNAENIYGHSKKQTYVEIINVPKVTDPNNYREIAASPCELKKLVCPIKNAKNFTWTRTLENDDSKVFQMNFNGNYTCTGENEAGVSNFTFIVRNAETPLSITIYLSSPVSKVLNDLNQTDSITTEIGKQLTAHCEVEGAAATTDIHWLKDNQEYTSEDTIEIYALQPDDIGEYTCIADNELGQVTKSFQVNLSAPPKFKYDIGDKQTLPLESETSTSLDCTAFASPEPSFNWYFNDDLLENESQDTYRLENVNEFTAGIYQCYVSNSLGSIEREFIVELTEPNLSAPNVPDNVEIVEPDELRLPCTIAYSSTSFSTYMWTFQDDQYILSHDDPLVLGTTETLYFSNNKADYTTETEAANDSNTYGVLSKSSDGSQITFELVIQKTKFDQNTGEYTCSISNSVNEMQNTVSVDVLPRN